jgi:hypothetical protein
VVKLELNKGVNKMAIFGKGGYDSPENKKRIEKKEAVIKKEKEKKLQEYRKRQVASAKESDTMLVKDIKSFKDLAKGGNDVVRDFKRAFAPTAAEKKEEAEMRPRYMEQLEKRNKEEGIEYRKKRKAQKAGAPDNTGKYVYDAVIRERQKKIKPSSLISTTNPQKVAKTMKDQVDAMKKQDAKRGAEETKEMKHGGLVDRNYLKGR